MVRLSVAAFASGFTELELARIGVCKLSDKPGDARGIRAFIVTLCSGYARREVRAMPQALKDGSGRGRQAADDPTPARHTERSGQPESVVFSVQHARRTVADAACHRSREAGAGPRVEAAVNGEAAKRGV